MELLFTYGTLMKGQKAHNSYPDMSYISDQYCQTMVSMRQVKKTITVLYQLKDLMWVEIYSIDEEILKKLDEYEEEGDIYIIKKTKVLTADNEELNVWFYEYNHDVK